MSPVRLRAALDALPAYVAGKPAAARADLTVYKVSSNENPYPPLPSVLETVREHAGLMNRYPDMSVSALTEAIAAHLGVDPTTVATGTGSVGVLGQLVQATCDAGDEVVFAWRSFEAYPIVVTVAGAVPVPVPLTAQHRHDLDAMAEAITERTRMVLVCTPNNPTGTAVTQTELEDFLARVPDDVLVVVDEAYLEFVEGDDPVDGLALLRAHDNVALLRTFSKAYGLAGLRVGYAAAPPEVAGALRKTAVPFGVSSLAQVAAVASLEAGDELAARVRELVGERTRVLEALRAAGWDLPPSQANFVWFPVGEATPDLVAACDAAGLVVRPYGTEGVRVTIGEPEANDRLVEVATAFPH
ncbi:histidinol-phosphate transaminase [Janibacter alkaliphilus]|uniref:Aromatic amino acid aminotransferase n=1 Tax=Janibacter alkaliphilus TaxID=1069963 RepID=A0A852X476_9MICO|nr:histidinol-phosphate transaminase [Janibacter alkaliphilus]NYG36150.1 histidinol-phosphate aminotransferase [Janibacter alkaliphilus]